MARAEVSPIELDNFIVNNGLDDQAAGALRAELPRNVRHVLDRGAVADFPNPSLEVHNRLRLARMEDLPTPTPRRLAAGSFHNLVISNSENKKEDEEGGDDGNDDFFEDYDYEDHFSFKGHSALWGFGSTRNYVLPKSWAPHMKEPPKLWTQPQKFLKDKYLYEVDCAGNHSVLIEKHPDQDGGQLWVCGLSTNGRLGIGKRQHIMKDMRDRERKSKMDYFDKSATRNEANEIVRQETLDQLARPSMPRLVKLPFPDDEKVIHIACGIDHTLALTERGAVFSWGLGSFGNLGHGTTDDIDVPREINFFSGRPVSMLAAGPKHSMALTRKRVVYSWGHGGHGRLGQGKAKQASLFPREIYMASSKTGMISIAAGEAHSAAIDEMENIYCWGAGSYGRTGHGEESDCPEPKMLQTLCDTPSKQVALGTVHSLSLSIAGEVWAWGSGDATGLAKPGGTDIIRTPKRLVDAFKDDDEGPRVVVQIATGCFHSLAMLSTGEVYSWGLGSEGRLGLKNVPGITAVLGDQKAPMRIMLPDLPFKGHVSEEPVEDEDAKRENKDATDAGRPKSIYCGGMHSGTLLDNGTVYVWGSCEFGATGTTDKMDVREPRPIEVKDLRTLNAINVECMAFGMDHCIALAEDKKIYSWGRNHMGQLGLGHSEGYKDEVDWYYEPSIVQAISDVRGIAAGEDHSAAFLGNGDLYTWGSVECGKLGQGSTMTQGIQNYPIRVRGIDDNITHVRCGAQHTACISSHGDVFTFGAGWYGRLGHGDTSNQYSPKQVEGLGMPAGAEGGSMNMTNGNVSDVQCGAYHTVFIVGVERELWVCGRDRAVCGEDHVLAPIQFRTVGLPVKAVAVGANHTLCISGKQQDMSLWAWGDNTKGQLGLGTEGRVTGVQKVKLPNSVMVKDIKIAAGHAHSMILMEQGTKDLYAWGGQGAGRLGIGDSQKGEVAVLEPRKVKAKWKNEEEEEDEAVEDSKEAELTEEGGGKKKPRHSGARSFGELQRALAEEDDDQKIEELQKSEREMIDKYEEVMKSIDGLMDQPEPGMRRASEYTLRQLKARFDRSVCRNLLYMGLADDYPNLDKLRIHPDIAQRLHFFEEMVWVLQQQPCYLARLSPCLVIGDVTVITGLPQGDLVLPQDIFPKVCQSIFARLRTHRIRHLFLALIRVLLSSEIDAAVDNGLELSMFDHKTSRASLLTGQLVEHGHWERFHGRLLDVNSKGSLTAVVWEWTKKVRAKVAQDKDGPEDILICFRQEELKQLHDERSKKEKKDKGKAAQPQMDIQGLKVELGHHLERLRSLFAMEETLKVDREDEEEKADFPGFMQALKLPGELGGLLSHIKDEYEDKLQDEAKEEDDEEQDPVKAYEPCARLLMGMLGQMLLKVDSIMSIEHKTRLQHKVNEELEKRPQGIPVAFNQCMENLKNLGAFLIYAAQEERLSHTKPDKPLANFVRLKFLDAVSGKLLEDAEDKTETMLTIDLYTSHFDVEEYTVGMDTFDLLNLSNAFWMFRDKVVLLDNPMDDKLYQLLDGIQPQPADDDPKHKGVKRTAKKEALSAKRLWPPEIMIIAERTNVTHNMKILHRFLEFHKDLCFCRDCKAPITRSMAPQNQRAQTERRLIKTYKRRLFTKKGSLEPDQECHKAAEVLEMIFKKPHPEIAPIRAQDFLSLRYEFEENQRSTSEKMAKDTGMTTEEKRKKYQLVSDIEKGKKAIDTLRGEGVSEKDLIEYFNAVMEERQEQKVYLQDVEKGLQEIKTSEKKYGESMADMVNALQSVVQSSEEAVLPDIFKLRASDAGCTLKFAQVEKAKRREAKNEAMSELQKGRTLYPSATYSLLWLRAKKVIAWVAEELPKNQYRNVLFTFESSEGGDWDIRVSHEEKRKTRALFTFNISRQELQQFQTAGKSAKVKYNKGWVVINAFNLVQLLARVTAAAS